jgi:4-hydroxybenzoate polyprenyltransferase
MKSTRPRPDDRLLDRVPAPGRAFPLAAASSSASGPRLLPTTFSPSLAVDFLQLCRPKDWVKNVFVLLAVLFTEALYQPSTYAVLMLAFSCFCLWSSAIYLVNDTLDANRDRQHPRKRQRAIAAGRIRPAVALSMAGVLVAVAALAAAVLLPPLFLLIGFLYLANSLVYCLFLKHEAIVDVFLIAVGFVLRILAGCAVLACQPSSWIIICGFSLALVLGFGKRRAEVVNLRSPSDVRPSLRCYDSAKLDVLLAICCSVCLLSYLLYTLAAETVERHGTRGLIYTLPFVAYGLFRFVFKVQDGKGDGPTDILLHDRNFLLNGLLWGLAVILILIIK